MRKLMRRIDHMLRTRETWKRGNAESTERKIAKLEAEVLQIHG
jgi:polyhydroxyalkanoate synthesis regulator phasin